MWYNSKLAITCNTDTMCSEDSQDLFWLCDILVMWRTIHSFKVTAASSAVTKNAANISKEKLLV